MTPSCDVTSTIKVLFFAAARDAVDGESEIDIAWNAFGDSDDTTLAPPPTTITSNTVRDYLIHKYPKLYPYIHRDITAITMALNEVYIPYGVDLPIQPNDVIAIIPPISGG